MEFKHVNTKISKVKPWTSEFWQLVQKGYNYDIVNQRYERGDNHVEFISVLYPHQIDGVNWMYNRIKRSHNIGFVLADDMGLGKTIQILAHITADKPKKDGSPRQTLVIVPKSILQQWYRETLKHTTYNQSDVYIYYQNNREIPNNARIIITTSQTLVHDMGVKNRKTLLGHFWHRVVIDESSAIRNRNTQFYKSTSRLMYRYGICVSGTPINNDIKDLYPQIEFARIPKPEFMANCRGNDWLKMAKICNQELLESWRTKYLLRRTKTMLKLPPAIPQSIELIMSPDELEAYSSAMASAQYNYNSWNYSKNKTLDGYSRVLLQILRMRQACNHCNLSNMNSIHSNEKACLYCGNYDEDMKNINPCDKHVVCSNCIPRKVSTCWFCSIDPIQPKNNSSTKINKLFQLVSKIPEDEKIVVFSQWTSMLSIIKSRAKTLGYQYANLDGSMVVNERERQIKRFNRDKSCRIFLVSLKAGGMGLNLTRANHVFLMDPWWNPFIEQQAIDRAHRIGQKRPVYIYRFYMKYTIEDWMNQLKLIKIDRSNMVIGKCEFNMGTSSTVNKKDIEGLFKFTSGYMTELRNRVQQV